MFTHRLFNLFIVAMLVAVIALTACTPQVELTTTITPAPAATPVQEDEPIPSASVATLVADEPITLRLAVADSEGRPSEPYVLAFVKEVKTLSNGNITIEATWEAGDETEAGFETGVIQLVRDGTFELGLAGSRAFDTEGVMSFQALQAPFLITNDALAKAIATSDVATQMLDSLSLAGAVGLTLWPEDLRHPFSLMPDQPILSPEDFVGLSVRAVPSGVTYLLIDTLGGDPMMGDDYQAAESGLRQGASLTGTPAATGNVVFFPKFQVLFANGDAFEKLSEAQRNILREAAITTQKKAIAEHPSEADAATAWCADGGTIVLASDEQVAAFEKAAQPVFDSIAQDPLNAELIAAIRDLKANTPPAPGAEACAPQVTQQNPEPGDTQVSSQGLPPNGTWTVELSIEDIVGMGVLRSNAPAWAGVWTWTFQDGKAVLQAQVDINFECEATLDVIEDFVRFTYSGNEYCSKDEVDDVQWRLDDDGLHLHLVAIKGALFVENKAYLEAKPWQLISAP